MGMKHQHCYAGDFEACEMKALLEQTLGSWRREASQPDQVPAVPNTPIPQFAPGADTVYLVDRPGLTQVSSWLYLGPRLRIWPCLIPEAKPLMFVFDICSGV